MIKRPAHTLTDDEMKMMRLVRLVMSPEDCVAISTLTKSLEISDVRARQIVNTLVEKGKLRIIKPYENRTDRPHVVPV